MSRIDNEILRAGERLSSLVHATDQVIGDAAKQGYRKHRKISRKKDLQNEPLDPDVEESSPYYAMRRVVYPREIQPEGAITSGQGLVVVRTATEIHRAEYPLPIGGLSLHLPAQDKLVTVSYKDPRIDNDDPHSVDISIHGDVSINSRPVRRLYSPYPDIGDTGYADPYSLRMDYTRVSIAKLTATEFMAETLFRAEGLGVDVRELRELQRAWRKVSPIKMEPSVAVLLPKRSG